MRRLRDIAINLALSLVSVLVFLALCEFVLFRYIIPASDAPELDFKNDVVRYAPNQQGVWRVRDEIAAPYRINAQGWNSGIGDYVEERKAQTTRIAVVGDSYVEALQVANTDSFAEKLGQALRAEGMATEVFRFGIGGAPLSQYVHLVEREVVRYRPDWIVVNVIHNDFDESYRFVQGRYTSSFMKFRIEGDEVVAEIPPTPWRPRWIETLRQTATVRFFLYRWQVRPQLVLDLFLPRRDEDGQVAANVGVSQILANQRELEAATDHAVKRLSALAAGMGARLLLVMNGDLAAIYRGNPSSSPALVLNRILARSAQRHGTPLIDMHSIFAAHWAANRKRFNFESDGHWNELGHAVVAETIAKKVQPHR